MKTLIANWKMQLGVRESVSLARAVVRGLRGMDEVPHVYVAPSSVALADVGKVLGRSRVQLAAQHTHHERVGAFTGGVAAKTLKEVGAKAVLVGHSERRALGETPEQLHGQAQQALEAGLDLVVCVGESASQQEAGETLQVVETQLDQVLKGLSIATSRQLMIAYEPIWAIGTGKRPTIHDVADVHTHIRTHVLTLTGQEPRVLYGGSVEPDSAYEFVSHSSVDGVLVGGASLRAASLMELIQLISEQA